MSRRNTLSKSGKMKKKQNKNQKFLMHHRVNEKSVEKEKKNHKMANKQNHLQKKKKNGFGMCMRFMCLKFAKINFHFYCQPFIYSLLSYIYL